MGNDSYSTTSSANITVRLSADGKNWKDWVKQLINYASAHSAFRVLDGQACPDYDAAADKYVTLPLNHPKSTPGESAEAAQKALAVVASLNQYVRDHNSEVRATKKEDETAYNNWVSRDAQLQNTIMSSIAASIIPHVRVCLTAHAMYTALKELNQSTDYANATVAWGAFIDLRADTCKSVREYIAKFRETLSDLDINGITLGWSQSNNVDKSSKTEELMVIHFLHGLASVLPDWVETRNNDLRKGDKWTIDKLIPSLEDHLRRAAEEPVKTFLTVARQKEEQRVLSRRNKNQNQAQTLTTTTVKPADSTMTQTQILL